MFFPLFLSIIDIKGDIMDENFKRNLQEYKEKLIEINNLKQAKIAIKEEHKNI